jgi:hypothetical protein
MENSLFHGSVVAWAMMILPIVLIIVLNKKHGLEILTVFKSLTGEIMVY